MRKDITISDITLKDFPGGMAWDMETRNDEK
jgi:hypothetical protein